MRAKGNAVSRRTTFCRWMARRGWNTPRHDQHLRGRLHHLAVDCYPWWDWGHRVMVLTGTAWGGSYKQPEPGWWWYRAIPAKPMWRTGYPRRSFQIVTNYDEFRQLTAGLNEDQMYEWQAIGIHDGELSLGHRYWGGTFYGLPKDETAILRRYLRRWRRLDWWGLRSWLYTQALHAAVHQRKPFSCQAIPARGSGGYDHWHCQLRRRHAGQHRYRSMAWDADGLVHKHGDLDAERPGPVRP